MWDIFTSLPYFEPTITWIVMFTSRCLFLVIVIGVVFLSCLTRISKKRRWRIVLFLLPLLVPLEIICLTSLFVINVHTTNASREHYVHDTEQLYETATALSGDKIFQSENVTIRFTGKERGREERLVFLIEKPYTNTIPFTILIKIPHSTYGDVDLSPWQGPQLKIVDLSFGNKIRYAIIPQE